MRWPGGGLRRDAPLLLAFALAVFVALAGFTLLAYRSAVARLELEREGEAAALADRLAREAGRVGSAGVETLARAVPPGAALALFDAHGRALGAFGFAESPALAVADVDPAALAGPVALGPALSGRPAVVAIAPFRSASERRYLRLDLPAAALDAERRSLARLTPLVLGLSLAAALVMLLSMRALARPYDALLARARAAGADVDARDELAELLATFDRALGALGAGSGGLDGLQRALGSELDGGFLLLDREGALLAATPAAAELLDLAAPATGTPLAVAFARRPELARLLGEAVRSGGALPRGAVRFERGGGAATVGVTAEPLRGGGGRPRGWLVVVADWTELERRDAQERLADGLAQLGELAAGVAHELRNSLATLSGWVTLARRHPVPPEVAESLDEIARESSALARVVEDFLAFARPGTRRLDPVDLARLLERAAHDPLLAGIAVEIDARPGATLLGDAGLLERALRNLLANAERAERAAGRDGPLGLALAERAGGWEITVDDRGAGVPAAMRERLFEPFASGEPGGAGLGLALARRIVVLHGGSLALEDRPGGGTRARIQLPGVQMDTVRNESGPEENPGRSPTGF